MPEDYREDRPTPPSLRVDREELPSSQQDRAVIGRIRRRPRILVGIIVTGAVLLLASAATLWTVGGPPRSWIVRRGGGTVTPRTIDITPPPSLKDLSVAYPELSRLLEDPALSSVYKEFLIAYEEGGPAAARDLAAERGLLNDREEIRITLLLDRADSVSSMIEELVDVGITVEGSYGMRINVGVPLSLIEELSDEQGVHSLFERLTEMEHIIRLELPLRNRVDRLSAVEGEGVTVIGADAWHSVGVTGQGIRIGVLDLGFDGYRGLLGGELPEQVSAKSFVYGKEPDASEEVHGTACAEIVHEIAPGAELFLAYYDGSAVSEGQAVDWLLDQDVHIISHSAGSVMAPMDGTGPNAELADRAASRGVLWVNSAGNEGESHYRAQFTDADGDGLHEFPTGSEYIGFRLYGDGVTVILTWDDWAQVTEDYDIYVSDPQGNLVAKAEDTQDGSPGQMAAEGLMIYQSNETTLFASILAYETSRPGLLDLYVPGASIEFPVVEHSLGSPADAQGALAVGATEHYDDSIASYSSQGPTTDGRLKPELSAPAGVSGATYGDQGFDGTSASAPHVAGAAALVWSAFPGMDRQEVASYLMSHARDYGVTGPDNAYGHGRIQLPPPPEIGESPVLPSATEVALPTVVAETVAPVLTPVLTSTPPATMGAIDGSPTPAGGELSGSERSGPPAVLLVGLTLLGFSGGVAVLGGAGLLLLARRGQGLREAPAYGLEPAPPPPPTRYGRLEGADSGSFPLRQGTSVIGRDPNCDVVLRSTKVSRRHARVDCAEGVCRVEDLGSSNGTFIDGEQVTQGLLRPGCRLRLGDVVLTYLAADDRGTQARLLVGGKSYPVRAAGLGIGRSGENEVRLDDQLSSRRHARIECWVGEWVVVDLDSTNGTYLNGRPINRERLRDGDRIRIGDTHLEFRSGVGSDRQGR